MSGTAIITQFQLAVSGWLDDQLPLTYAWTAHSGSLGLPVYAATTATSVQVSDGVSK